MLGAHFLTLAALNTVLCSAEVFGQVGVIGEIHRPALLLQMLPHILVVEGEILALMCWVR